MEAYAAFTPTLFKSLMGDDRNCGGVSSRPTAPHTTEDSPTASTAFTASLYAPMDRGDEKLRARPNTAAAD